MSRGWSCRLLVQRSAETVVASGLCLVFVVAVAVAVAVAVDSRLCGCWVVAIRRMVATRDTHSLSRMQEWQLPS